jgi:hypothetical protein
MQTQTMMLRTLWLEFLPFQIYHCSSENYNRPSKIESVSALIFPPMTIISSPKALKLGNLGTHFLRNQ